VKPALLILALAAPQMRAESLNDVLLRMDQAARTFKSMLADVHRTDYSDLFSETNAEDGTFRMMKRAKTGVVLLAEFTGRDPRKLRIADNKLEIYHPKANSKDEYNTRKFTKSADELLLVGFGTSRADLEKKYNISLGGSETHRSQTQISRGKKFLQHNSAGDSGRQRQSDSGEGSVGQRE
jgi:hypothetical protein